MSNRKPIRTVPLMPGQPNIRDTKPEQHSKTRLVSDLLTQLETAYLATLRGLNEPDALRANIGKANRLKAQIIELVASLE